MALSVASPEPWKDDKSVPLIRIENVRKTFGEFVAVDGVDVSIYKGELFSLLGGSGCGKTTLLRMLAGFETPTSGRIMIDGVDVSTVPPYERPVNMMFQSYALFPHMTVESNVAFGLKQDGIAKSEIESRVNDVLELVQLAQFKKRKPHQLSGGQRQRVALARALVKRPKVLLLDEPLSALDKKLREKTQFELVNIQEKVGITFVMVTHDQEEAMTMSSRIAVMQTGRIVQIGTPTEIYEFPRNRYVADFIGSVNLFDGILADDQPDHCVIGCDDGLQVYVGHGITGTLGMKLSVAIRPEKIRLTKNFGAAGHNRVRGRIREIAYLGDVSVYHVQLPSGRVLTVTSPNVERNVDRPFTWEDEVELYWDEYASVVLTQ